MMTTQLKMVFFALALSGFISGTLVFTSNVARAGSAYYQADNMSVFGNETDLVPGVGTLTRTSHGIAFSISTSELAPDEVHSVWIAIFHKPENCAAGPGVCVPSDLGVPEVEGSLVYGAGGIVGQDGIGHFAGRLGTGSPPAGVQVNVPLGTVNGLEKPLTADIHLVVRRHGLVDDLGGAAAQLTTFQAAECAACANVQAVVFPGRAGGGEGDDEDGVNCSLQLLGLPCP